MFWFSFGIFSGEKTKQTRRNPLRRAGPGLQFPSNVYAKCARHNFSVGWENWARLNSRAWCFRCFPSEKNKKNKWKKASELFQRLAKILPYVPTQLKENPSATSLHDFHGEKLKKPNIMDEYTAITWMRVWKKTLEWNERTNLWRKIKILLVGKWKNPACCFTTSTESNQQP